MAIEKLTVQEAAAYLNVHSETIRRRIKKGEMKAEKHTTKFGEQWLIPFEEVTRGTFGGEIIYTNPCMEQEDIKGTLQEVTKPLYNQIQVQNNLLLKQSQIIESLEDKLSSLERELKKVRVDINETTSIIEQGQNRLENNMELCLSGHSELLQDTLLETLESDLLERKMVHTETNHVLEFIRLEQAAMNESVSDLNENQKRIERNLESRDLEIVAQMRRSQTKKPLLSRLLPIKL